MRSAAIGKPQIAQDDIDVLGLDNLHGARSPIGRAHVRVLAEHPREQAQHVALVVDDEHDRSHPRHASPSVATAGRRT